MTPQEFIHTLITEFKLKKGVVYDLSKRILVRYKYYNSETLNYEEDFDVVSRIIIKEENGKDYVTLICDNGVCVTAEEVDLAQNGLADFTRELFVNAVKFKKSKVK